MEFEFKIHLEFFTVYNCYFKSFEMIIAYFSSKPSTMLQIYILLKVYLTKIAEFKYRLTRKIIWSCKRLLISISYEFSIHIKFIRLQLFFMILYLNWKPFKNVYKMFIWKTVNHLTNLHSLSIYQILIYLFRHTSVCMYLLCDFHNEYFFISLLCTCTCIYIL